VKVRYRTDERRSSKLAAATYPTALK